MNIRQDCILSLLEKSGIESVYTDVHEIGSVSYYFSEPHYPILKFTNSCVPEEIALHYLKLFSLDHFFSEIRQEECFCNW